MGQYGHLVSARTRSGVERLLTELQLAYAQVPDSKGEAYPPCEIIFPCGYDSWYAHASHGHLRRWLLEFDSVQEEAVR